MHHNNDIVRFFTWQGIKCDPGMSFIGRDMKFCSDRFRFKVSEALMGDVQYDAVLKKMAQSSR